jgi:very-short-patch-repair endonuclease
MGRGMKMRKSGRKKEQVDSPESAGSPRHLWRGARGEVGITGSQPVAAGKLEFARKFRREMTSQGRTLWEALRRNQLEGLHFRRQQVIGGFVADFYCASGRLAIEIDGDSHLSRIEYDAERDRALAGMGIRTLRITNDAVDIDLERVLKRIAETALPS